MCRQMSLKHNDAQTIDLEHQVEPATIHKQNVNIKTQKPITEIFRKTVSDVTGTPREHPGTIGQSSREKCVSNKFHYVCQLRAKNCEY